MGVKQPNPSDRAISVPFKLKRRGGKKLVITPDHAPTIVRTDRRDAVMIKTLARGFRWRALLDGGKYATIEDLGRREQISPSYVGRVIRLTFLAPDIVEAILNGTQPRLLDTKSLLRPFPAEWNAQKRHFGFDPGDD